MKWKANVIGAGNVSLVPQLLMVVFSMLLCCYMCAGIAFNHYRYRAMYSKDLILALYDYIRNVHCPCFIYQTHQDVNLVCQPNSLLEHHIPAFEGRLPVAVRGCPCSK